MPAGVGATTFFELGAQVDGTKAILHATVLDSHDRLVTENHIPLKEPKNMALPKATVSFAVADTAAADGSVNIKVTSNAFALYVTLTTTAQGRFSDNAFVLPAGSVDIAFMPFQGFDIAELKRTLRVEHTQSYM